MTHRISFLLAAALVLGACSPAAEQAPVASTQTTPATPLPMDGAGSEAVARVQGVEISRAWLEAMARARNLSLDDPEQRGRALDELVEYLLLVEHTRRSPELDSADARADIELNALAARASAILANLNRDPDEAALRAEYDQQAQINGDREFHVAHMLFTEAEPALAASQAVHAGQAFDEAMTGWRDQAQQAVDLGWVKLGQLPPEFAAVLPGLEAGQTAAEPVQTAYGWHVIHVQASRPFQPVPYEQVREGIRRMLVAQQGREIIESLKAQATIEVATR
ncbi:MAG: peptidylprolyl isomerase [Xanthomonadales bacterium]|nr:peptidylprolyl isomerase [Xanthomonadales bacterium]